MYTKNWKKISQEMLKESKCDICKNKAEIIHHKNLIKSDNRKQNLVPLCKKCHAKVHTRDDFYKNNHAPRNYERIKNEIIKKIRK